MLRAETGTVVRRTSWRPWLTRALVVVVAIGAVYVGARAVRRGRLMYRTWQGLRLNRTAWEAGYRERSLPLPDGPRDGYWGARIGSQTRDERLGWVLPPLHYPGLLEVDAHGMQHARSVTAPRLRILIVGASVAFGGYASTIDRTYFAQLVRRLEQNRLPVDLTVFATGAWKSSQEIDALHFHGLDVRPDLVVFLDGLNDLTNGSNADTWYGVKTRTLDGSPWSPLYSEQDLGARVERYSAHMSAAYGELHRKGIPLVVILQPALFEKRAQSKIEQAIERASLPFYGPKDQLQSAYAAMRRRLHELAERPDAYFIDCSHTFDGDPATVFTDIWHFSDPGHTMLADAIAPPLEAIARRYVDTRPASFDRGGPRS